MSQRYNSLSMSKRCFRCQPVTFIVKEFSRRWYKRWSTHVLMKIRVFSSSQPTTTLKKEFQCKLNQSRTRSQRRAGDYPKIPMVGRAARGIRWSKLRSVEDFEKLGAKLDRESLIDPYSCSLEQGKVFSTSMRYVPGGKSVRSWLRANKSRIPVSFAPLQHPIKNQHTLG
jgi:hypothetical protein